MSLERGDDPNCGGPSLGAPILGSVLGKQLRTHDGSMCVCRSQQSNDDGRIPGAEPRSGAPRASSRRRRSLSRVLFNDVRGDCPVGFLDQGIVMTAQSGRRSSSFAIT